jgi:hypothetical protein
MKLSVFDRSRYHKCCDDHPSFYKDRKTGLWYAECKTCRKVASGELPEDLPAAWATELAKT